MPKLYRKYSLSKREHQLVKRLALAGIGKMIADGGVEDEIGGWVDIDFKGFTDMSYSDYHIRDKRYTERRIWRQPVIEATRPMFEHYAGQFGAREARVDGMWFAQYYKDAQFKWHTHEGCNTSAIYFMETPNPEDITEFYGIDMPEMKEGDVAVFPSSIPHRARINKNPETRKTVVGFNINICNVKSELT